MQIVFLFYEGMTALDAVGPHEILSRFPGAKLQRVAKNAGPISTDSGLVLRAESAMSDVSSADILVVPGAGNATSMRGDLETLEWVRFMHMTSTWTTSVCTGSLILGAAGVLKGLKATSHWAALDRLPMWGAKPVDARVVEDGKVITAAGVSSGIDMALMLAAKVVSPQFAQAIQLGIEYDPQPPFDVGSPGKANPAIREALRTKMTALFESLE